MITPAELKAQRIEEMAHARRYLKWALMNTIELLAQANAMDPISPIRCEAAGQLTRLWGDLLTLDDVIEQYTLGDGPFEDYIL